MNMTTHFLNSLHLFGLRTMAILEYEQLLHRIYASHRTLFGMLIDHPTATVTRFAPPAIRH